jgi:tetratricopeptide (TPR) repeat protein
VPRYRKLLAIAYTIRGQVLRDLNKRELASEAFTEAIREYDHLIDQENEENNRLVHWLGAATASRHAARFLHMIGDHDAAEQEYKTAEEWFRKVWERKRSDWDALDGLAACLEHQGDLMHDVAKTTDAEKCYRDALDHRKGLPDNPIYEFRKAALLLKIGELTDEEGPNVEALKIANKLVELSPKYAMFSTILGAAQLRDGKADECITTLEETYFGIDDQACPERDFWLAMAYRARGNSGDSEKAKDLYDRAVEYMDSQAPGCVALLQIRARTRETLGIPPTTAPTSNSADGPSATKPGEDE